jgi:nicotinic acid mononucleotide adenylyltransferase
MKYSQFITEATTATAKPAAKKKQEEPLDKHVAITFGRFNPPHAGHGKLLDTVRSHAGDSGNYRIYPSRSQDHKKNPLGAHEKVGFMRKMFPDHDKAIQNNEAHRNIFDIMRDLHDEGHEHVTMVVGDDRVKEFENLLHKYNGKHYNFKSINIKSAGKRADDSEDPIENLSASKMRAHTQNDDHGSFHAGMTKHMKPKDSMALMQAVKAGMTPPPEEKKPAAKKKVAAVKEMYLWEYAPKLDFASFREEYMVNQIFQVGALVEHDDTGIRGTIVHRGPNYAIFKDEHGDEFRSWLQHITEVNDQTNYSADCEGDSGNQWTVGSDEYRQAVQAMTPGQGVVKFSDFKRKLNNKRPTAKV